MSILQSTVGSEAERCQRLAALASSCTGGCNTWFVGCASLGDAEAR